MKNSQVLSPSGPAYIRRNNIATSTSVTNRRNAARQTTTQRKNIMSKFFSIPTMAAVNQRFFFLMAQKKPISNFYKSIGILTLRDEYSKTTGVRRRARGGL